KLTTKFLVLSSSDLNHFIKLDIPAASEENKGASLCPSSKLRSLKLRIKSWITRANSRAGPVAPSIEPVSYKFLRDIPASAAMGAVTRVEKSLPSFLACFSKL